MSEVLAQMVQAGGIGGGLVWVVTAGLLIAGLIGCVVPVLPGHLLIFVAALGHRLMLGREESGLEWWSLVVLGLLMVVSQGLEFLSGAAGSRWFGGSRWGALGAIVGALAGLFFLPFGLLVGPLAGAFLMEMAVARKKPRPAMVSGVGSVIGTVAGMGIKVVVGVLMLGWFLADVFLIG